MYEPYDQIEHWDDVVKVMSACKILNGVLVAVRPMNNALYARAGYTEEVDGD